VPLCQYADHALHTDSTIDSLELWGIVTELRRCQRAQLAELIERQFRVQQFQLFWQRWRRQPKRWWGQPECWRQ